MSDGRGRFRTARRKAESASRACFKSDVLRGAGLAPIAADVRSSVFAMAGSLPGAMEGLQVLFFPFVLLNTARTPKSCSENSASAYVYTN